jgi:hypothetical protein
MAGRDSGLHVLHASSPISVRKQRQPRSPVRRDGDQKRGEVNMSAYDSLGHIGENNARGRII